MGGKNKMIQDKVQDRTQIAGFIAAVLLLAAGFHALPAQNMPQSKVLSDAKYRHSAEYKAGNKYQKDAILFMDMVADTHPFYVDAGRRAEWLAKKPSLIDKCKDIASDEAFVDALNDVLGPIHDGHTNLTTVKRAREGKQAGNPSADSPDMPGTIDTDHVMRRHRSYYDYHIFPEWRICYLQFNQCANEADRPFDKFLVDMFAQMDEADVKTLVVDAQYNPGGNSQLCDQLLQHLYPAAKMKRFTTYIRFSDLLADYNSKMANAKKKWERGGHKDELYRVPASRLPEGYQQPKLFDGQVVFVMGKRTFSSAGMLMTLTRDNHIGTIIGTTSSFPPSHYGEILPFRLPNTEVVGTICCKYFVRPDADAVDEPSMKPDVEIDLADKDKAWRYICETFGFGPEE